MRTSWISACNSGPAGALGHPVAACPPAWSDARQQTAARRPARCSRSPAWVLPLLPGPGLRAGHRAEEEGWGSPRPGQLDRRTATPCLSPSVEGRQRPQGGAVPHGLGGSGAGKGSERSVCLQGPPLLPRPRPARLHLLPPPGLAPVQGVWPLSGLQRLRDSGTGYFRGGLPRACPLRTRPGWRPSDPPTHPASPQQMPLMPGQPFHMLRLHQLPWAWPGPWRILPGQWPLAGTQQLFSQRERPPCCALSVPRTESLWHLQDTLSQARPWWAQLR